MSSLTSSTRRAGTTSRDAAPPNRPRTGPKQFAPGTYLVRLAGTTRNLIVGVTTQRVRLEVAIMCGDRASARSDAEALASLLDVAVIEGTEAADDTGAVAWTLVQVEIALTLARLHLAARRPEEALALTSQAMKWRAARGGVGHAESALRLSHAEALEASGQRDLARAARREARASLLDRAAKIEDPAARATFLEAVPENAATMALLP